MIRLADGDRAAFDPVYSALLPVVETFCRRLLGAGPDAEDAAQHALIKIFEQAGAFDPARDALAWALSIAAWECRTVRRRRARSRAVGEEHLEPVCCGGPSPEDQAIARDLEKAALAILGGLSPSDRETLIATFEGERDGSIALATFRKRRERALARLREAWRRVYGS